MSRLLRSKKINMVMALLIAIGLYIYVVGEVNPKTEYTIKEIPVAIVGEDTLWNKNIALVDPGVVMTSVKIRGSRSEVRSIEPKDVSVTADVSGLAKGNHIVKLKVVTPTNVTVVDSEPKSINVKIEERDFAFKKVEVKFKGKGPVDSTGKEIRVYPDKIQVSGAKSIVAKVDHIEVIVRMEELKLEESVFRVRSKAVDSAGNGIKMVKLSDEYVEVRAKLLEAKSAL